MQRTEQLIQQNQAAGRDLDEQYTLAKQRRDQVRAMLRERTEEALLDNLSLGR